MLCRDCIYFEKGDDSVGLGCGCTHDFLYDDKGNLIESNNDIVVEYMVQEKCPLKEEGK